MRASPATWRRPAPPGEEILEYCISVGGSITGEHGVGMEKNELMDHQFSSRTLDMMRRFKDLVRSGQPSESRQSSAHGQRLPGDPPLRHGRNDVAEIANGQSLAVPTLHSVQKDILRGAATVRMCGAYCERGAGAAGNSGGSDTGAALGVGSDDAAISFRPMAR